MLPASPPASVPTRPAARRRRPAARWAGAVLLAAAVALGAAGCARTEAEPGPLPVPELPPRVLVVSDATDAASQAVAGQARHALREARVPFDETDVASAFAPADYGAVLLAAERIRLMRPAVAAELTAMVARGGGVVQLFRGWSADLAPLLGLPAQSPGFAAASGTYATRLALMPAEDGLALPVPSESMLDVPDPPGCDVIGRVGRRAASWTCARGAGRVVVWNGTRFTNKRYRGHIVQSLALVDPATVRPLANWAVVYIDDFPSPAPTGTIASIQREFGVSVADFYAHRWYPDMRRLADAFGVVYTSTVTFAYNGRTEAPFSFEEWLASSVEVDGRRVPYAPWVAREEARVSEMALHGYNHQSLVLANWGGPAPMKQALRRARGRWQVEEIGPLPTTYVPPMNWIDSVGTAALHEAMPEVRAVAGLYWGDQGVAGQDQEFGPDPWVPALYDFPRNTAGFDLHPTARLEMLSLLHTVGAWGHFVHPDEILPNEDREEMYRAAGLPSPQSVGWHGARRDGLYFEFAAWLRVVRDAYPWLEYVRADEGLRRMQARDALRLAAVPARADAASASAGRTLTVHASRTGHDVLVVARRGEHLAAVEGGAVRSAWRGPLLGQYVVRQTAGQMTLTFRPGPGPGLPS